MDLALISIVFVRQSWNFITMDTLMFRILLKNIQKLLEKILFRIKVNKKIFPIKKKIHIDK